MVLRWKNKKLVFSTQERIHPNYFETDKEKKLWQRVKTSFPGYTEFNARLDFMESTAGTAYRQFLNDNHRVPEPVELKQILDVRLRNISAPQRQTLMQFISAFISEAENGKINRETGKTLAKATVQIYKRTLERLREFESYYGKKVDFDTINLEFYDKWMEYLSVELQLSNNTVGKHTKMIKAFLNEAAERGLTSNLAFRSKRFRVITESTYKIYLNEAELIEMFNLNLKDEARLSRARDLFIVGCWTGLRFKDLVNIAPENVVGDKISIKTQKTGEVVVLPVHWMVKSIMEKYREYPNSLPPAISNVKLNKYIKEVAEKVPCLADKVLVSITRGGTVITESKAKWQCVTVHTARRSFATNLYLDGVNSLTIMKLTAHKSEKVFLSYLKASAEENANLVQEHWLKKGAGQEGVGKVESLSASPGTPVGVNRQRA